VAEANAKAEANLAGWQRAQADLSTPPPQRAGERRERQVC